MTPSAATAARDGQTSLALRLTKHLAPSSSAGAGAARENVAFSPLSVHAALALVAAGARGATRAQLLAFLGAPSAASLAMFGRRLADLVLADRSASGGPRVLFGCGVWADASHGALAEEFRDVAANSYKSEATAVDFTKVKGTDNLIDSIISPTDITAVTDLILANAVYFKGEWLEPFDSLSTQKDTFHRLDGSCVEAMFMWNLEWLKVSCTDGFKVLKLPYKQGHSRGAKASQDACDTEYSMFVFLPDERDGLATMVDVITATPSYLYSVLEKTQTRPVWIMLPKFEINFTWNGLKSDLIKLGLSLPFSPEAADLRGMYEDDSGRPTFLTKVAQRAIVKVNEKGTEAAAATMLLRGGGGPPPDMVEFVADHPFTFFIMEERSGVIVFAGHNTTGHDPTFMWNMPKAGMDQVRTAEQKHGTEAAAVTVRLRGGGGPPPDMVEFVADHPFTFFIMEERSGVIVFAGHVLDPTVLSGCLAGCVLNFWSAEY
uniref:Serpin domain-containing protein n=1 Tax=Oryza meridionalis TaxID=40149 RepID=A0A0E0F6Z7_9ORYZ